MKTCSNRAAVLVICSFCVACAQTTSVHAQCVEQWLEPAWGQAGFRGISGGGDVYAHEFASWDPDGSGPMQEHLVVCGVFLAAGGVAATSIAAWDGAQWYALGDGYSENGRQGTAWDVTVHNGVLTVAGDLYDSVLQKGAGQVLQWDGSAWSRLGASLVRDTTSSGLVYSIASYNGSLYAGGRFDSAGGVVLNNIARWSGTSWQPVQGGLSGTSAPNVRRLTVYDNKLIVCGTFTFAGSIESSGIVAWNGSTWVQEFPTYNGNARDAAVIGNDLYVVGNISTPTGGAKLAKWDGNAWTEIPNDLTGGRNSPGIASVTSYNGQAHIAGSFDSIDGVAANSVARWDGSSWHPVGDGTSYDHDVIRAWNGMLLCGGDFTFAEDRPASRIAAWDGSNWVALGDGDSLDDIVNVIDTYNGTLIVGGGFASAGETVLNNIGVWNGNTWEALGGGVTDPTSGRVYDIQVFAGSLYVGGNFELAGATPVDGLAQWDGTQWHTVGDPGLGVTLGGVIVYDMAVYDDKLVCGGDFNTADGVSAINIAIWDGGSWAPMGTGLEGSSVRRLAVMQGDVYAAGYLTDPTLGRLARWDGTTWVSVSGGVVSTTSSSPLIDDMAVRETDLFIAGRFDLAGGIPARSIARWDGLSWHAVGLPSVSEYIAIDAIAFHNNDLYVAGIFDNIGGIVADGFARWDGSVWQPADGGFDDFVNDLCSINGSLYAGGLFATAAGVFSPHLAAYGCDSACYADCDSSSSLNIFDYICFGNEYSAATLYADCDGSGSLNVFDYICFGNAYAAGCP
ncbi:MAG: hypothetical protein H6815_04515 [Phycisphaeraceae bacterium]|nr:hypothetical protein [Phycisphaerales bacterium]MCB9859696.1 hypothetical protein [Phycisphaeraceae bacterium]